MLERLELNSIEVLISKLLIDAAVSHDESALINIVPKNIMEWKKT